MSIVLNAAPNTNRQIESSFFYLKTMIPTKTLSAGLQHWCVPSMAMNACELGSKKASVPG